MSPAADPFGVHEALGWFLVWAIIAIPFGIAHVRARRRKAAAAPLLRRGTGQPVVRDVIPPCHVTGCPIPGYVRVTRVRHLGGALEQLDVCHGHADEGEVYGWWLRELGFRRQAAS